MTREGRSPAVVGAVLAVVAVATFVAVFVVRSGGLATRSKEVTADARVMLAVVVPDMRGVATPVAITLYPAFPDGPSGELVDPATRVTVSGTSANTLRAAYPYGGGAVLAAGIAQARAVPAPYWVVVDQGAQQRAAAGSRIRVRLGHPIDVFDGTRLSSFPSGTVDVAASQLAPLMAGARLLSGAEGTSVRADVAAAVVRMLVARGADTSGVATDLSPQQLSAWLARMRPYVPAAR